MPRLALEVALAGSTSGAEEAPVFEEPAPPPTRLPPQFGHPLPSVLVSRTLERELHLAEERPPRRRVHGTAEIVRRPMLPEWRLAEPLAAAAMPVRDTARVQLPGSSPWAATRAALLLLVPAALAVALVLSRL